MIFRATIILLCVTTLLPVSVFGSNVDSVNATVTSADLSTGKTVGEWAQDLTAVTLNFLPNVNPGQTPGTPGSNPAAGTPGAATPGIFDNLFGNSNNNLGFPAAVGTLAGSAVLVSRKLKGKPWLKAVLAKSKLKPLITAVLKKGPVLKPWLKGLLTRKTATVKGGFLSLLTLAKSIVIPAILTMLLIAFLVAGAAFFTCSVVDCQSTFAALRTRDSNDFNASAHLDDRNAIDYYDNFRPIYKAIEDGRSKYSVQVKGHGHGI